MIRPLAAVFALALAGCATAQDLGHDPKPGETPSDGLSSTTTATAVPTPTAVPLAATSCPATAPFEGTQCNAALPFCVYANPNEALGVRCTCAADRRWTCVRVLDPRHGDVDRALLPVTDASCSEGARCGARVRCTVPKQRTCLCTSNGHFVCSKQAE